MTYRTDTPSGKSGKGIKHQSVVGRRFKMLTVESQRTENGRSIAICRCDCGRETRVRVSRLFAGQEGCPCRKGSLSGRHGHAALNVSTPTYRTWGSMKERCSNPEHVSWDRYGGRGIAVCERWLAFDNFLLDMGERPSLQHSIDRIDGDKGYEPGNCRWADLKTQARNQKTNVILAHNGVSACVAEWADITGLPHNTIRKRLLAGWSVERTLTAPHRTRGIAA